MDTQNTPIHVKLWHREFWLLAIPNLLLTMSIYMLIPVLPPQLLQRGAAFWQVALAMGIFGVGLFSLGGFCSYLVQRYRRNQVCMISMVGIIACLLLLYYLTTLPRQMVELWMVLIIRFLMGAFFGLSQMVLCSTLVIDTCESFQRTQANYAMAWFSRFAVSLGPVYSLLIYKLFNFNMVLLGSGICIFVAIILIRMVNFPFKAPEEDMKVYSTDRFFLFQGWPLFINLVMITSILGILLAIPHTGQFYAILMLGFLIAMLSEKYVFQNADLKSEVVSGLIFIGISFLLMLTRHQQIVDMLVPSFVGFGIGIIGSRFLLFFIKLANHCQRGTSQSTFFLGWELGACLGIAIGFLFHEETEILIIGLALTILSLLLYRFLVHSWYMKNKNR